MLIINKLKSTSGESITEALISALIAVLGILLFAMMVSTSFNIVSRSEEKMQDYYATQNLAEGQETALKQNVPMSISVGGTMGISTNGLIKENDTTGVKVSVYGNDDAMTYRRED